jgi:hypothetical protein
MKHFLRHICPEIIKNHSGIFISLFLAALVMSCGNPFEAPQVSTTNFKGTVRDFYDDSVIEGASVSLDNARNEVTNANGAFEFEGIETGNYTLIVKKAGYKDTSYTINFKVSSNLNYRVIKLTPRDDNYKINISSFGLDTVTGYAPYTQNFSYNISDLQDSVLPSNIAQQYFNPVWRICHLLSLDSCISDTSVASVVQGNVSISQAGTYLLILEDPLNPGLRADTVTIDLPDTSLRYELYMGNNQVSNTTINDFYPFNGTFEYKVLFGPTDSIPSATVHDIFDPFWQIERVSTGGIYNSGEIISGNSFNIAINEAGNYRIIIADTSRDDIKEDTVFVGLPPDSAFRYAAYLGGSEISGDTLRAFYPYFRNFTYAILDPSDTAMADSFINTVFRPYARVCSLDAGTLVVLYDSVLLVQSDTFNLTLSNAGFYRVVIGDSIRAGVRKDTFYVELPQDDRFDYVIFYDGNPAPDTIIGIIPAEGSSPFISSAFTYNFQDRQGVFTVMDSLVFSPTWNLCHLYTADSCTTQSTSDSSYIPSLQMYFHGTYNLIISSANQRSFNEDTVCLILKRQPKFQIKLEAKDSADYDTAFDYVKGLVPKWYKLSYDYPDSENVWQGPSAPYVYWRFYDMAVSSTVQDPILSGQGFGTEFWARNLQGRYYTLILSIYPQDDTLLPTDIIPDTMEFMMTQNSPPVVSINPNLQFPYANDTTVRITVDTLYDPDSVSGFDDYVQRYYWEYYIEGHQTITDTFFIDRDVLEIEHSFNRYLLNHYVVRLIAKDTRDAEAMDSIRFLIY